MAESPSAALRRLGFELPPAPQPKGSYAPAVRAGPQVYISGQGPMRGGVTIYPGHVDANVSIAQAQEGARLAVLQGLAAAAQLLGSIDQIRRVVRVVVYVASSPGFNRQHEVGNGATECLLAIFGEAGRPARVSVGVPSLPLDFPVEVEMLLLAE
ncbi:MAG: RidA family protein [Thermoplasmata archaeon]|nr:RidA family protein [Thermoplasmata archaeon]MCI4341380.1 RidA family protein [Thermoplasmata archaeon]